MKQEIIEPGRGHSNNITDYADRVSIAWRAALQSIIEVGVILNDAKENLDRKDWLDLINNNLPFTRRTAEKLIKISSDARLSNPKNARYLPPHWTSLHEITYLTDEQFEDGKEQGIIRADAERKEISVYVKSFKIKEPADRDEDTNGEAKDLAPGHDETFPLASIRSSSLLADWQIEKIEKSLQALCKKHGIELDLHPPKQDAAAKAAERKKLASEIEAWLHKRKKTYNVGISQEKIDILSDTFYQLENWKYPIAPEGQEFAANDIRNPKHPYFEKYKADLYPYCEEKKIITRYTPIERVDYEAYLESLVMRHCIGNVRERAEAHKKLERRSKSSNPERANLAKAALAKLVI
ncbi:DUF3102 domain-containing protein [Rhodospirillales bacterium]|nr:DUF3102 domain-containing protein [Rhodospirillales bacterium]